MGRQPQLNPAHRAKGPAGTGRSRKRDRRIKERSAKDAHRQLAALKQAQNPSKKRKKNTAKKDPDADSSDAEDDSGNPNKARKTDGGQNAKTTPAKSTGFEKAVNIQEGQNISFQRNFWMGPAAEPGEPSQELKMQRKAIGIKVRGCPIPPPIESLNDTGLPPSFKKLFQPKKHGGLGLEKPTPIQAQVWPAALSGVDLIGIAPTGSGKTLAYLLPALPHVAAQKPQEANKGQGLTALVLVPTRELARQVAEACGGSSSNSWLKRFYNLRCAAVYGGMGKEMQVDTMMTLGTPQIVAATPGRLLDLLALGVVSLSSVTYLVLDEGDRMLALGFEPQLSAIMKSVPPNRQLSLFSATFPGKLREAAEAWMAKERVLIRVATMEMQQDDDEAADTAAAKAAEEEQAAEKVDGEAAAAADDAAVASSSGKGGSTSSSLAASRTIHQSIEYCLEVKRPARLVRFLHALRGKERSDGRRQRSAVLVFCAQIKTLRNLEKHLNKHGERSAALHSQLPQARREQALEDLKNGKVDTLIATDVASRGLHISRLRYVVNYEFPASLETYCHRIGRVGRNGAEGWAHSFVDRNQASMAANLQALLKNCDQPPSPCLEALAAGREVIPTADEAPDDSEGEEAEELRPKASARIVGLQGAVELNGKLVCVQRQVPETGRWEVKLRSGEIKAVKAENLELSSKSKSAQKAEVSSSKKADSGQNQAPGEAIDQKEKKKLEGDDAMSEDDDDDEGAESDDEEDEDDEAELNEQGKEESLPGKHNDNKEGRSQNEEEDDEEDEEEDEEEEDLEFEDEAAKPKAAKRKVGSASGKAKPKRKRLSKKKRKQLAAAAAATSTVSAASATPAAAKAKAKAVPAKSSAPSSSSKGSKKKGVGSFWFKS